MSLRDQLDNMTPREQRLLTLLGGIFGLMLFVGVPVYIWTEVAAAREHNDKMAELLRQMDRAEALLAKRQAERLARDQRWAKPAPPLGTFIQNAARANSLDVQETKDKSEVPHDGFTEKVTEAEVRKVGLKQLVKTLERMESSGHPVAITKLSIKKKISPPDTYDVRFAVSAYEKSESSDKDKGKSKAKSSKGKTP